MRIYLFVYTFSPLSICTPGDNIQSLNGKKRERETPSFLPSPHEQKIVCCTIDSACVVFRSLLLPSFSSDLAIHSAPENELERKCKWILLHRIAWLRAVIDKMSVRTRKLSLGQGTRMKGSSYGFCKIRGE